MALLLSQSLLLPFNCPALAAASGASSLSCHSGAMNQGSMQVQVSTEWAAGRRCCVRYLCDLRRMSRGSAPWPPPIQYRAFGDDECALPAETECSSDLVWDLP